MGGRAFSSLLPGTSFPRLSPTQYKALKETLVLRLRDLYALVAVPCEDPEKEDHGDIDIVVSGPRRADLPHKIDITAKDYVHASIPDIDQQWSNITGALCSMAWKRTERPDGHGTSNFALPLNSSQGHRSPVSDPDADTIEEFFQVDINLCCDEEEWKRVVFFHSYGDMGVILGLMPKPFGLHLGLNGLKITEVPLNVAHYQLSSDFSSILAFIGLEMSRWEEGFQSRQEIFEWISTSSFFFPWLRSIGRSSHENGNVKKLRFPKQISSRPMFTKFITWVTHATIPSSDDKEIKTEKWAIDGALEFFGKTSEFNAILETHYRHRRMRELWSGSRVNEWAELHNHWRAVKKVMDGVRARVGGDAGILNLGEEELIAMVKEVGVEVKTAALVQG